MMPGVLTRSASTQFLSTRPLPLFMPSTIRAHASALRLGWVRHRMRAAAMRCGREESDVAVATKADT